MDERKIRILNAIIHSYLEIPIPVGSRKISKEYDLGVSSATIRNEMSDLEDLGYLNKPHTSAGRIPSDKAFRFFVEEFKKQGNRIAREEKIVISDGFKGAFYSTEDLFSQAAKILANISRYPAFVLAPRPLDRIVQKIDIFPLSSDTLLVLLVGDQGIVEKNQIRLPKDLAKDLDQEELAKLKYFLNKMLCGVDFSKLQSIHVQFSEDMAKYKDLLSTIISLAANLGNKVESIEVYSEGLGSILYLDEFQDLNKARLLLKFMENPENIVEAFPKETSLGKIHVQIGSENEEEILQDSSLVTASYALDVGREGQIGVIGPVRMNYPWIISLVNAISENLSRDLDG